MCGGGRKGGDMWNYGSRARPWGRERFAAHSLLLRPLVWGWTSGRLSSNGRRSVPAQVLHFPGPPKLGEEPFFVYHRLVWFDEQQRFRCGVAQAERHVEVPLSPVALGVWSILHLQRHLSAGPAFFWTRTT